MRTIVYADFGLRHRTAVFDRDTAGIDDVSKQTLWLETMKREKRDISQDPVYRDDQVIVVDVNFGQEFTVAGFFASVRYECGNGVIQLD